jgi:UDP-glucose 4-epimerase
LSGGGVLVTGGAGFIGSWLVRALLERGERVTVFDDLSVGLRTNVPARAAFVQGSVTDAPAVEAAMRGHDRVVHFAARVAIRSSFDFAVEDTHTNVVGTAAVMRAAQRCGAARVIAASSMAVYADHERAQPIGELHPTRPISPYGISKLAAEQLVLGMGRAAGVGSVVLRFFNTYGPGQALSPYVGAVTIFTHAIAAGRVPVIYGDGEQCRDFVHVADVVQAVLAALDSPVSGEIFNVGTGVATSVNRVCTLVREALGPSSPQPAHAPAVAGELRYSIADIAKARRLLGYSPSHRLDDALPDVVRAIAVHAQV